MVIFETWSKPLSATIRFRNRAVENKPENDDIDYSNCKQQEFFATENTEIHGKNHKSENEIICKKFISFHHKSSVFFRG